MTAIFVHDGDIIDYRPPVATPAGTVVVHGDLVGMTVRDIAAGALGGLRVTGVFDVPRTPGGVMGVGFRLYWDAASQMATIHDDGGSNPYLGRVVRESGDGDATVRIRLEQ